MISRINELVSRMTLFDMHSQIKQDMDPNDFTQARILIVDDQEANVFLLEEYFEQIGVRSVASTVNPFDTFDLYQTFHPDIILLDLMMPGLNGFQILDEMKALVPEGHFLPILVLTADLNEESKKLALAKGATDFLLKPFDLTEVGLRIRNMIRTRFLHLKLQEQNQNLATIIDERTHDLKLAYESLKKAKEELEVLDKAKLEFLGIISHEIRTPLNGILGFTGLLKQKIDMPQLIQYIDYLELSAKRLEAFSTKALLITELRSGQYKSQLQNVNLGLLLKRVVANQEETQREKSVKVLFDEQLYLVFLHADAVLLEMCFEKLLDNAVRFSPVGGCVKLEYSNDDVNVKIVITDEGPGFSDKALKHLFGIFGIGSKHEDNTFGLNLAIVKQIVDYHKGTIEVANLPDKGAEVTLVLPQFIDNN